MAVMYEILANRAIIEVFGDDAMKLLHNLITNDIKNTNYCYTYALNNQGKYLFDFFILKLSNTRFFIDININQSNLFKNYLMRYKLRAKIRVNDVTDVYQIVYSKQQLEFNGYQDPRCNKLGFRSIVNKNTILANGIKGLYLQDKYNYTIVDGYEDLIFERSIPVEYGCEQLNAVSYTKGCYIGQEVISRIKYQGVIRKKIFKLSLNTSSLSHTLDISKQDEIMVNNTKIGVVCSSYKNNAIALIKMDDYRSLQNTVINVKNQVVSLCIPSWRAV